MEETVTAYISLGGNLGGEAERFGTALERMARWPGVAVTATSSLYTTQPQGDADQPWFVNQAAALACDSRRVMPANFLAAMLRLETELGRTRDANRRFGPRAIDLDLLLFGDIVCAEEGLCLPHPRMAERAFVLVPLLEIAPSLKFPGGTSLAASLGNLRYSVSNHIIFQEGNIDGKPK